ncbi:MAG TPA: hypothetical protein PKD90_13940, partial [Phnomibacter sp.]|nr:hypothetical protein [Phnomibacter sp.]
MADPASNIPANSLSLRITNMAMPMLDRERTSLRQELSVAAGLHKNLMAKASMYAGNMFTGKYRLEAGALYAKYRFLSNDDFHKHFRMAAFGKLTFSGNPIGPQKWITHQNPDGTTHTEMSNHLADELNIDGNHSGLTAGITATWLVH